MVVVISLRALLPKINYFRIPWTQTFCALLFSVYLCEKIILREWVSVRWLSWCQLVQYVLWLFFLKTWAEIESADQLYSVEEGVRSENRIRQTTISEPHRALKGSSMSPHRSSSRRLMNISSESHLQRDDSSDMYGDVVPSVEVTLSYRSWETSVKRSQTSNRLKLTFAIHQGFQSWPLSHPLHRPLIGQFFLERKKIFLPKKASVTSKTETARLLKIGLTTLYRKIEEYGINP